MNTFSEYLELGRNKNKALMCRVDSNTVLRNQQLETTKAQYQQLKEDWVANSRGVNPTTSCDQVEEAMFGWIGFSRYVWMSESRVKDNVYPKIAVKQKKSVQLIV